MGEVPAEMTQYRQPDRWLEEQRLRAKFLEYEQLKSEIQSRSDFQQRLIQLHMTVLIAILAAATSESVSRWILLLVPIESAIFGMWWMDHARSIRDIGGYLASHHETHIDKVLNAKNVMGWERRHLREGARNYASWWDALGSMHQWAFLYIALVITVLTLFAAIVVMPGDWQPEWVQDRELAVTRFFPMAEDYDAWRPWVLLVWFCVEALVIAKFLRLYRSFRQLVYKHHKEWAGRDVVTNGKGRGRFMRGRLH